MRVLPPGAMLVCVLTVWTAAATPKEEHAHAAPERLGRVVFETSCSPAVQADFQRAVALLHSFAYDAARQAFRSISQSDPRCAMAHWGIAQSHYHPLWQPPGPDELRQGAEAIDAALRAPGATGRERDYIQALAAYYREAGRTPEARARAHAAAMAAVSEKYPDDAEAQIFHALMLLATASLTDATHANQKQAARILEPLYAQQPRHPGLAHYLIHAYDSAELAARGLTAARAYSQIAPSAPHALHMPSHIFTRLGRWQDSIASNLAARQAAHEQGYLGEALHAMDYLTYAYLQLGRFADAERIVGGLAAMSAPSAAEFKTGYAASVMPVRLVIERGAWDEARALRPLPGAGPQVSAIVYWARAVGQARAGDPAAAAAELDSIERRHEQLRAAGDDYWARQTRILANEARAWIAFAGGKRLEGAALMRQAADEEDAVEKLPVTPGAVAPAREQLAEMLLESGQPTEALREFERALRSTPGRRRSLEGAKKSRALLEPASTGKLAAGRRPALQMHQQQ